MSGGKATEVMNLPAEEMKALADEQEGLFAAEERLARPRDLLVRRVPRRDKCLSTSRTSVMAGRTYSESTANETPTVLRKWFWTRMKSNDEGTKITVFALCTADFNTPGSTYDKTS